jgi:hypothetical protein
VTAPFENFKALTGRYGFAFACRAEAHAPCGLTDGEWRLLALECRDEVDRKNDYDAVLDFVAPPKRHQPAQRFTAATSQRPGAVALPSDDPLKNIGPATYIEALTGEAISASGWLCCPLPDHDERTPSFQVLSSHWRCFGCSRGGSIIDFGAAWYSLPPRGSGYKEIRRRLADDLGLRERT